MFSTNEDGRSAEELIAVDVNAYDNKYRFKAGGSITADAGGTDGAGPPNGGGGGASGQGAPGGNDNSGAGGSGIVIIRYKFQ